MFELFLYRIMESFLELPTLSRLQRFPSTYLNMYAAKQTYPAQILNQTDETALNLDGSSARESAHLIKIAEK